jgi:type II secretory pathway component PulK
MAVRAPAKHRTSALEDSSPPNSRAGPPLVQVSGLQQRQAQDVDPFVT